MLLKIAFRNIFRNNRRSILTMIVVVIGMMGVIFGIGWIGGIQKMMKDEGVRNTGDIRITSKDFEIKSRSFDVSSNLPYAIVKQEIEKYKFIKYALGRINFGSEIYLNDKHMTSLGHGIEKPDYDILNLHKYIYEGRFLDFNKNGEILVGKKIKDRLSLKLGDEITIISPTQYKSIGAGNFKIVGFYEMENGAFNRGYYIPLSDAQYLLDMDDLVTEFVCFTKNNNGDIDKYSNIIKDKLGKEYLVEPWDNIGFNKLYADVMGPIKLIISLVLLSLAGISIANTMIMVVFERKREIGVMKAIGVTNFEVIKILTVEGGILGLFGSLLGSIVGGGITLYYTINGIHIGNLINRVTTTLNFSTTVYPESSFANIFLAIGVGTGISIFMTFITILKEARHEVTEDLRN